MPEGDAPFDEGDHPVEGGPRDRRNSDLRPNQVDGETPHPGRYPEAHSHNGRPEEFRYDCADQGQSRVDLEGVEDKRRGSGQTQLEQRLPIGSGIGAHQVALHHRGGIEPGHGVHQHGEKGHGHDDGRFGLPVEAKPHHHDGGDADDRQCRHEIADRHDPGLEEGRAVNENRRNEARQTPNGIARQHRLDESLDEIGPQNAGFRGQPRPDG